MVGNVDVLNFRSIVEFFTNRLVAEGGKTREVEGCARSGGVGHIGGSGADTAGAKTGKEGSTVVLLGESHLEGSGGCAGDSVVYLRVRETEGVPRRVESRRKGDWAWRERVRKQREIAVGSWTDVG